MLRIGLAIAFLAGSAVIVQAQSVEEPADGIRQAISEQIAAFEADDFAAAFSYASPGIRAMFGTPARFAQMVRAGYPMVWRPGAVEFSGPDAEGGRTLQRVLITDRAGALHVLEYEMVPGAQGWRIDGVRLLADGAAGA